MTRTLFHDSFHKFIMVKHVKGVHFVVVLYINRHVSAKFLVYTVTFQSHLKEELGSIPIYTINE